MHFEVSEWRCTSCVWSASVLIMTVWVYSGYKYGQWTLLRSIGHLALELPIGLTLCACILFSVLCSRPGQRAQSNCVHSETDYFTRQSIVLDHVTLRDATLQFIWPSMFPENVLRFVMPDRDTSNPTRDPFLIIKCKKIGAW